MVRPDTALNAIATALKESGRLPEATTYSVYEIDSDGSQANLRPPIVEITTNDVVRSNSHNTDLVDYATDDNGNDIGRIYEARFEMPVQIDVWTAEQGEYDPYEIGQAVRYALYQYDTQQRGDPLPDPTDPTQTVPEVSRFMMGDGGVRNDLSMTPALRRWRQSAEMWFHETVNTAEEYGADDHIAQVVTGDGTVIASENESDVKALDPSRNDGIHIEFSTV